MKPSRKRLLLTMLIAAVILCVAGAILTPIIEQSTTVQQRADNAIIGGLGVILIIIGIIVAFIDLIIFLATLLNHSVPERPYTIILNIFIAGIVFGVIGMFQPFAFIFYQIGFLMLFVSLIGFMIWGHLVPKGVQRQQEISNVSIGEVEKHSVGS